MRHAFHNQAHFAFDNVNDLLLRMRMRRHLTTRRQCGEHLIHCLSVRDRPARDPGTNFNRRTFWFHGRDLTTQLRMTRLFWGAVVAAIWFRRLPKRTLLLCSSADVLRKDLDTFTFPGFPRS